MHAAISSPDPQASGDGTSMPVSRLLQLDVYIVICRPKCYVNSSSRPKEATVRSIEQFANSAVSPLPREPSAAYVYNLGCNYSPRHGDVASWRAFIATKWSNKYLWIVFEDDRIFRLYCRVGRGYMYKPRSRVCFLECLRNGCSQCKPLLPLAVVCCSNLVRV